jgi:DNA-binding NarL/FixJ family response regulator
MRATSSIAVLVADDHPLFRRGLCETIADDASLRLVGEAGDGQQAWELVQKLKPAVAVLDIHMPHRTGLELSALISQQHLPVKVIILTMDADPGLLNQALNRGVQGYLVKETAISDILDAIHRVALGGLYISPDLTAALARRNAAREAFREQKVGLTLLSPTERKILKLIAEDRTSKEIADLLECSVRTIDAHRGNISRKLELSGTHSLLRFAFDHKSEL